MDDIGTIIYIGFLLLSLFGGLWSNAMKKKREEARQHPPAPPAQAQPYQTVPPNVEQLKNLSRRQQAQKEEAEQRLEQMGREAAAAMEGGRVKRKTRKSRDERLQQYEHQPEETPAEPDLAEFDARKAIIYSEILKPPYL